VQSYRQRTRWLQLMPYLQLQLQLQLQVQLQVQVQVQVLGARCLQVRLAHWW
jgi:hypothetical protein